MTDLPIRRMNYPPSSTDTTRGVLLASYTWGQDALQWGAMDPETRLEEALDDVARIHPRIREEYEVGTSATPGTATAGRAARSRCSRPTSRPSSRPPSSRPRAASTSPASTARCITPGSRGRSRAASAAAREIHEAGAGVAAVYPVQARVCPASDEGIEQGVRFVSNLASTSRPFPWRAWVQEARRCATSQGRCTDCGRSSRPPVFLTGVSRASFLSGSRACRGFWFRLSSGSNPSAPPA